MIEGRASRTAQEQAMVRAMESLLPKDTRICDDPLAVEFLDDRMRKGLQRARKSRFWASVWLFVLSIDPSGSKAEAVARTRYIDDYLQVGIKSGVQQVVILGAGCDSRAYRIKGLERIMVFEVDHRDTQKKKMATLKRVLGSLPSWVTYVPLDFEKDELHEGLVSSGYKQDLRTLFIWEGVTMYLTAESVDRTLAFVATTSGRGSSIIFNFWQKTAAEGKSKFKWAQILKRNAERIGEPIRFGIEGLEVEAFMLARGFSDVKRVTPAALTQLYFKGKDSKRKVCPFVEIVHARVDGCAGDSK